MTAQSAISKKKENVAAMFNDIAASYDFLNHLLSAHIDKLWRKKAVKLLASYKPEIILDVATGTGDLAIALQKLNPERTVGIDIAEEMLEIGRRKIIQLEFQNKIELKLGDALNLTFPVSSFDTVTVSFGIRNFEDIDKGISQIFNVLTSTGRLMILEFSRPKKSILGWTFKFYFGKILPLVGKLFSKNKVAYKYLFDTVQQFPSVEEMKLKLTKHGFKEIKTKSLSFGIATIYIASK